MQIGGEKGSLPGLVYDRFHREGVQLRHDVVPPFAADEDAPHGAGVADALSLGAVEKLVAGFGRFESGFEWFV